MTWQWYPCAQGLGFPTNEQESALTALESMFEIRGEQAVHGLRMPTKARVCDRSFSAS